MNDARDLTCHLADLLRREQHDLADFLVALADFDRGRRWLELGYTSCFYFLHRELGLSKGAAFYRKTAAELIQRFPAIVEPLRDGRLCITSVVELAKVITPENQGEVVARFFHASKREAKEVVAELRPLEAAPHREVVTVPRPAVAPRVSGVSPRMGAQASVAGALVSAPADATVHPANLVHPANQVAPVPSSSAAAPRPDEVEPLTADLRRYHFTVSRRFLAKLSAARDALSHSHPNASTEAVLEAALDLLLAKKAKQKGLVEKPRTAPQGTSDRPRHIPDAVKRAVWTRDGGRCQWPVASGGICGSTTRLELDHILPVARGGESTLENLRVVCKIHNGLAARKTFGDGWMDRFAAKTPPHGSAQVCTIDGRPSSS